ncbi:MAG TPA: hypothetical protein VMN39_06165, partial [Longimicrobiaceae bacterium]|nr:hypothetical protein [Longimicrobiaceae bacterium]
MTGTFRRAVAPLLLCLAPAGLAAQSLDLTIDGVGISIGDSPGVTGLRLNFRDRNLERVIGANVTIWNPHEHTGHVTGLALGLPITGAAQINGIAAGVFGVGAEQSIRGITVTGVGAGVGQDLV